MSTYFQHALDGLKWLYTTDVSHVYSFSSLNVVKHIDDKTATHASKYRRRQNTLISIFKRDTTVGIFKRGEPDVSLVIIISCRFLFTMCVSVCLGVWYVWRVLSSCSFRVYCKIMGEFKGEESPGSKV